ncbi:MAG: hypothetical protein DHS20C15_18910 [Planctomycetota bacterium]|nr:MAG: hypothetical protein DHS20C15_18910 [Planctomycetota bacterium]
MLSSRRLIHALIVFAALTVQIFASDGQSPVLEAAGAARPGSLNTLVVSGASPHRVATLVLAGDPAVDADALGLAPQRVVHNLSTDASGGLRLPFTLPRHVPVGLTVYAQLWVADDDARTGWVSSNTLAFSVRGATPTGLHFPIPRFDVGAAPSAVANADLNQDGVLDILSANADSDDVSVLLGLGNGVFGAATHFAAGGGPIALSVADLDLDGALDVVVLNARSTDVSVLRGAGDGALLAAQTFSVSPDPVDLGVADLNNDGLPDVVVAGGASREISTLLGLGDGTLASAHTHSTSLDPAALTLGDIDHDGNVDITLVFNRATSGSFAPNQSAGQPAQPSGVTGSASEIGVEAAFEHLTGGGPFGNDPVEFRHLGGDTLAVNVLLGSGDGSFALGSARALHGVRVTDAELADFNADGALDLVLVDRDLGRVSVSLGSGLGDFGTTTRHDLGSAPRRAAVADLNADGAADIAVVDQNSDDVWVLLGAGNGDFAAAQSFDVGPFPSSIALGDHDQDGHVDLLCANRTADDVSLLRGNGSGDFTRTPHFPSAPLVPLPGLVGLSPKALALGDVDGDGLNDLAAVNSINAQALVFRGLGGGEFAEPTSLTAAGFTNTVLITELHGDNLTDLVVGCSSSTEGLTLLPGSGAGHFGAQIYQVGAPPEDLAVADFNLDGRPDTATPARFSSNVSVLLGQLDGSLGAHQAFPVGGNPIAIAAGDINADGAPDFTTVNLVSNSVSVRLGLGNGSFAAPTTTPLGVAPTEMTLGDADLDGFLDLAVSTHDGVTVLLSDDSGDFDSVSAYPAGSNPISVAMQDFDLDGLPDLAVGGSIGFFPATGIMSVLNGTGLGVFGAPQAYTVFGTPRSVEVGDLDLDGFPDLVSASNNGVLVQRGRGSNGFLPVQTFGAGIAPERVAIGDLDLDGLPDVAVANLLQLSVLRGNGDSSLGPPTNYLGDFRPEGMAIVDLNQDGLPDILATKESQDELAVLRGAGDGAFLARSDIATHGPVRALASGDMNADGLEDLVFLGDTGSHSVSVMLGTGGGFGPEQLFASQQIGTLDDCALGDLDQNGTLDLVRTSSLSNRLSVLLGVGDGTLGAAMSFATGDTPTSLALGDLDLDGELDALVANATSQQVSVLWGLGDGNFTPAAHFAAGKAPSGVGLSDIDQDGQPDIAVTDSVSRKVSVLLGLGARDFAVPQGFATSDSPGELVIGDLDQDGAPDLAVATSGLVSVLLNELPD